MQLAKLTGDLECRIIGKKDIEISDIEINSDRVTKGTLFVCIEGQDFDSHNFIHQVEMYGAVAVVTNREIPSSVTQIIVNDTRKALSIMSAAFYDNVYKKMNLIAVVGTNGKTTTTHIIKNLLESAGVKCGVIGTLGCYFDDEYIEPSLTTPDPMDLHKILYQMYRKGVKNVAMEVSAHAIYHDKLYGVDFLCGIFTNLSQDHLDFFKDMETYQEAKLKFFRENYCKYIVTDSDDKTGLKILELYPKSITYGIDNPADVFAINIEKSNKGTKYVINLFDYIAEIDNELIGKFNVYNALAGATALALMGIPAKKITDGLNKLKCVSGRLEKIYSDNFEIFIDYAHTPDGLENALKTLKKLCKGKLINVFGCGGNRDKGKRKIMGKISGEYADFTIITSDNPRYEDPMEIINEIEDGILSVTKKYILIEDRKEAIAYALNKLDKGDILLIAGKGDERFQEVLGIKKLYNDKDTVRDIIRRKK